VPEVETVIRKVTRDERGGRTWFAGEIDPAKIDGKTVTKVETMKEELAALMMRLRDVGEPVLIEVTHKQREGQNGKIWDNFYLEGARAKPEEKPTFDEAPQRGGKSPDDAWRIALSVGAKLAVETLPYLPETERDPESQWGIAMFWASRIHTTPPPDPAESWALPGADEDIPF
jgi:hypothetical protein